jgi:hypothetical protein
MDICVASLYVPTLECANPPSVYSGNCMHFISSHVHSKEVNE